MRLPELEIMETIGRSLSQSMKPQRILINKSNALSSPTIRFDITRSGKINRKHHIDSHAAS